MEQSPHSLIPDFLFLSSQRDIQAAPICLYSIRRVRLISQAFNMGPRCSGGEALGPRHSLGSTSGDLGG